MRPLRLFLFWLINFSIVYGINVVSVLAWMSFGYDGIFLMMAMVNVPLATLFFGWWYLRPGFAHRLSQRIKNAIVWIALNLIGCMIILSFTPSMKALDIFSFEALISESFNFLALLIAGYVAVRHTARSKAALPLSLDLLPPAQE